MNLFQVYSFQGNFIYKCIFYFNFSLISIPENYLHIRKDHLLKN